MEELNTTGNCLLDKEIADIKMWRKFMTNKIDELKGEVHLMINDQEMVVFDLEVNQIIPPENKTLHFCNMDNITKFAETEEERGARIIFDGLMRVANQIFSNVWGLIGVISVDGERAASIIIVYIEAYQIWKYTIITQTDVKPLETKTWHEN
ncbi:MAG: hypothetical protein WCO66_00830 [Candidatus Absconditabacteria bacterium]